MKSVILILLVISSVFVLNSCSDQYTFSNPTDNITKEVNYLSGSSNTIGSVDFSNLNNSILSNELDEIGEAYELIIKKINSQTLDGNSFDSNIGVINDFLIIQGKKPINVNSFVQGGMEIIHNPNSSFDQLLSFIRKYNIYSNNSLEAVKELNDQINEGINQNFLNRSILDFNSKIINSDISFIEKNFFLTYSKIIHQWKKKK